LSISFKQPNKVIDRINQINVRLNFLKVFIIVLFLGYIVSLLAIKFFYINENLKQSATII
jgi:cell division protein FtsI/penicillin-binding protein 2